MRKSPDQKNCSPSKKRPTVGIGESKEVRMRLKSLFDEEKLNIAAFQTAMAKRDGSTSTTRQRTRNYMSSFLTTENESAGVSKNPSYMKETMARTTKKLRPKTAVKAKPVNNAATRRTD